MEKQLLGFATTMQGEPQRNTANKASTYALMAAMLLVMACPVVVIHCSGVRMGVLAAVLASPFLAVLYAWTIRRCMRQAAELPTPVFVVYLIFCFIPATLFLLGVGGYLSLFVLSVLLHCIC